MGDLDDPDDTGSGDDGDEIEVDLEMDVNTVTVIATAENAYDDRVYSFTVTRMAPVANTLADLGLRSTRDATGSAIPISPPFRAEKTEYTATVPTGTGTGDDMSVYVLATVKLLQQAITVTYSDGGTMTELDAENPRNNDGPREKVYKVTIPKTGALNDKSVLVKVTSEDGEALTYDIQLQRGDDVDPGTASLTALSLTGATLAPAFASAVMDYTASVAHDVASTTVTWTESTGATAGITPADADATTDGHQVNLAVGDTEITIAVTGTGMTPSTYTVTVTRAEDPSTPAEPGLTLNPEELEIAEGLADTYTMALKTLPTGDVTVAVSSADPDVVTV